jgi:hypothetical protein
MLALPEKEKAAIAVFINANLSCHYHSCGSPAVLPGRE